MTIQDYVLNSLVKYPRTRADDNELVRRVFRDYAADHGLSVEEADRTARALPSFPKVKTIVRTRANLQRKNPELTDPEALKNRAEYEEQYRAMYSPKNESGD